MSSIRWFYVLLAAIAVAGGTLAFQRLFDIERNLLLEAILAVSILAVFISFLGFLARLRE